MLHYILGYIGLSYLCMLLLTFPIAMSLCEYLKIKDEEDKVIVVVFWTGSYNDYDCGYITSVWFLICL